MYIANIVSRTRTTFNDKLFNITDDITSINPKLPTLVVGWGFAKEIYQDGTISILNKKIDKLTTWTFSRHEKRTEYEKDSKYFLESLIDGINRGVKYEYINVLTLTYEKTKKLMKFLSNLDVSCIYVYMNSFIYIYSSSTKAVYGIDFNMIDYLNIDRKKIYKKLYNLGEVFFSDDFVDDELKKHIKDNKIIPYIYNATRNRRENNHRSGIST